MEESLADTNSLSSSGEIKSGHSELHSRTEPNGHVFIILPPIRTKLVVIVHRLALYRAKKLDFP